MSTSTQRDRLSYDDAATPREMHGDCQAATARLRPTTPRHSSAATAHRPTRWTVPDEAARMADAIHLHLS